MTTEEEPWWVAERRVKEKAAAKARKERQLAYDVLPRAEVSKRGDFVVRVRGGHAGEELHIGRAIDGSLTIDAAQEYRWMLSDEERRALIAWLQS